MVNQVHWKIKLINYMNVKIAEHHQLYKGKQQLILDQIKNEQKC